MWLLAHQSHPNRRELTHSTAHTNIYRAVLYIATTFATCQHLSCSLTGGSRKSLHQKMMEREGILLQLIGSALQRALICFSLSTNLVIFCQHGILSTTMCLLREHPKPHKHSDEPSIWHMSTEQSESRNPSTQAVGWPLIHQVMGHVSSLGCDQSDPHRSG